ncbi:MAG: efflux RND transporter permease subunit, partial [Limisphaerales bacterium]
MLCSRFLRPRGEEARGALYRGSERVFDWMRHHYEQSLRWVLAHRLGTMVVSLLLLLATGYLFVVVPKGFIPSEDNSQVFVVTEAPQGASFDAMTRDQQRLAELVRGDPNVMQFFSSIGGGAGTSLGGPNFGRMFLHLKPPSERVLDVEGVIGELRSKLAAFPPMRVFMQNPPTIRIGGQLTKSLYQFSLQSPDIDTLFRIAPQFEAKLRAMHELEGVTSDLQIRTPQVEVQIDRQKAAALGVTVQQVENALGAAYGPRWISTIYAPNNQYEVLLELEPQFQSAPTDLSRLYITSNPTGTPTNAAAALVPLDALASVSDTAGPASINHLGQLPAVTISFNLKTGVSLGNVLSKIQDAARRTLPETISSSFQGAAQAFQSSLTGLGLLLVVTILVIYLVLGILYESFVHPLTILSGLPSAGFGALLTLLLFRVELNLYSFVGLILLIGIVKKNAI